MRRREPNRWRSLSDDTLESIKEGDVVLSDSPVAFELEVYHKVELDAGRIYLCRIRNVLVDAELCDEGSSLEYKMKAIAPVCSTGQTYFGWNGEKIAKWGEPGKTIRLR